MIFVDDDNRYCTEKIEDIKQLSNPSASQKEELKRFNQFIEWKYKNLYNLLNHKKCAKLNQFQLEQRAVAREYDVYEVLKLNMEQSIYIIKYAHQNGIAK